MSIKPPKKWIHKRHHPMGTVPQWSFVNLCICVRAKEITALAIILCNGLVKAVHQKWHFWSGILVFDWYGGTLWVFKTDNRVNGTFYSKEVQIIRSVPWPACWHDPFIIYLCNGWVKAVHRKWHVCSWIVFYWYGGTLWVFKTGNRVNDTFIRKKSWWFGPFHD